MPIPIVRKVIARGLVMRILLHAASTSLAASHTRQHVGASFEIIEHLSGSMARNNGRWGRLRRVLNEDLSTSSAAYASDGR